MVLLLLLSRLCSNAPRRTGAAVIIGSMVVRERERLEYHAPASLVPCRTSLRRLSIASNNEGRECIRVKKREGDEEGEETAGCSCCPFCTAVQPTLFAALQRWDLQQKAGDKRGYGLRSSSFRGGFYFLRGGRSC